MHRVELIGTFSSKIIPIKTKLGQNRTHHKYFSETISCLVLIILIINRDINVVVPGKKVLKVPSLDPPSVVTK